MSVAPVSPLAAALLTQPVGPTQAALNAVIQGAMLAEAAVLDEMMAPGPAPPAPPSSPAQAVDAARAAAAARQGSLAPLLADLTVAASAPTLPAPLRAAIGQVLALQLPAGGAVSAEDVRQAVAQSGLFLEAHLAAAPSAGAPPPDLKAALLVLQRALAAVPVPSAPAEAPRAQATPAQPTNPPVTADVLKQAAAQTGPFLEAHLTAPASPAGAPPTDLKAALAVLQRALTAPPAGAAPAPAPPAGSPAPSPGLSASSAAPPALPDALKAAVIQVVASQLPAAGPFTPAAIRQAVAQAVALLETQLAGADTATLEPPPDDAPPELRAALRVLQRALAANPAGAGPAEPHTAVPPPPPHRQAAPTAQAPARATLPADAEPAVIAQHLRGQVAQAVARQTLHQLASLPDGAGPAWMFELPLATPMGAAIAQFVIDRDGEAPSGADPAAQAWRARFSIDIEPLGPVHVHLRMEGDRTAVTVWAERAESLEQLRGGGGALARALPADVTFRGGVPPQPAPASGRFVDQTS